MHSSLLDTVYPSRIAQILNQVQNDYARLSVRAESRTRVGLLTAFKCYTELIYFSVALVIKKTLVVKT